MTNVNVNAESEGRMDFTRQRDWFDPTKSDARVTMVGCGGIGSPTVMALAKLGIPHITLIDGDIVDTHNLPNQMFPLDSIGLPKVDALADFCQTFSVSDIESKFGFLTTHGLCIPNEDDTQDPEFKACKPSGIVISGLDSMEARGEVWKTVKYNPSVELYIDARIGGDNVVIYVVNPTDPASCRHYEAEALDFSDEEAMELPCTRRSIIDVGFVVGSMITRLVRKHIAGDDIERTVYLSQDTLTFMNDKG